jgi:hypothetical protein
VFLFFSIAGIVVALRRRTISMPLFLLAALVLSAAAGIVLLWETSPRYSHPIHFALAIFAALGFGAIRHGILQFASGGSPIAWRLLRVLAALVAVWAILALTAYAAARQSPTFVDMRQATFTLNDTLLAGTPVDRSTESWETALTIPRGTPLPATVRVIPSFVDGSAGQHFRMSLRIPAVGGSPPRMVFRDCNGQIESWFPEDLVRMKRGCWQDRIEITLLPPQEQTTRTDQELALAVGYALRF